MHRTTLRKVGGSVMMAVPPALLEQLQFSAGSVVGVELDGGRLIVKATRPRYTLEELLAQCDHSIPMSDEEREWLDAPAVGNELF